jgi:capsular polysaccharide biosynthesis protein
MQTGRHAITFDLKALLPIIRKRKWLIILPWILVSAVVAGGSYLMTPIYEATTIITIDTEVKLSEELRSLLDMRQAYRRRLSSDQLRGYYNEITSTHYVSQLAARLGLAQDEALIAQARQLAAVSGMTVEATILQLLQNRLMAQVRVSHAAGDQIKITVESANPEQARDMANTLGEIFLQEKHQQEMATIRSSQNFSDIQLQKYETGLQNKINERTQLEKDYLKIQLDEAITSESNRSAITGEIDQTNTEINDLLREERSILNDLAVGSGVSTSSLMLEDSEATRQARSELRSELRSISGLMTRYTWSDPQVLNSKVAQNALIADLEAENRRLVAEQYGEYDQTARSLLVRLFNVRANLDYLYSKASYLESALDELTEKMNLVPEYQASLNRLNQEIVTATELRDRFKRQQESSTISQALLQDMSTSKYRVVEPAKTPLGPVRPERIKIILMGFVLGLVIGAAATAVAELMDTSFKKVEDIQEHLGLPVLGVTPRIDFLKKVTK